MLISCKVLNFMTSSAIGRNYFCFVFHENVLIALCFPKHIHNTNTFVDFREFPPYFLICKLRYHPGHIAQYPVVYWVQHVETFWFWLKHAPEKFVNVLSFLQVIPKCLQQGHIPTCTKLFNYVLKRWGWQGIGW